ncbi:MAG TPA: cation-translocating P-type ATPase [Candidatus Saccharimonadales bacterium]
MLGEYLLIIRRNLVNPLVIAIAVLVTSLLLLGEFRDAWFISVVITLNVLIAIIQEIRARRALRKLEILTAPKATRILPNDTKETVNIEAVAVGDVLYIEAGEQLTADGAVITSQGLECDESLLTGEARTIPKDTNDTVYAGSMAMAGKATVRVLAVGADTKAGAMVATLKRYEPEATPLQKRIARTIQLLTYAAIVLSVAIIVIYLARDLGMIAALKTVTAAGVTVVPEGLLLASTLLLAFGALNLARHKVLPQKLSAIEAMALLDVLCVDKTGTLTSDAMTLEKIVPLNDEPETYLRKVLYVLAKEASSHNPTSEALLRDIPRPDTYRVADILAFSSARKMSAVRLGEKVVAMGAPEVLLRHTTITKKMQESIDAMTEQGLRVLLVMRIDNYAGKLQQLPTTVKGRSIGLVVLKNALREQVRETVDFLQDRDVHIKVISGDNPKTVQYVAESAGIKVADKIITGAELEKLSAKEWDATVLATTIFARVLPEQKQRLLQTFQRVGNFTGMVGDGVNDALALKQSNLGVAMFAGAPATRRVADIILLDNSFTSLPVGMRLGNRIMQAIELIACLFFHKIVYGVVLLLGTLALNTMYPFLPRHITFMNIFLVTLPSVLWTLLPPETRQRVNPTHFWKNTALNVLPIALLSAAGVLFTYLWLLHRGGQELAMNAQTLTALAATVFGVALVFFVPRLLAVPAGKRLLRMRLLYAVSVVAIVALVFTVPFIRTFLDFVSPDFSDALIPALVVIGTVAAQYWLSGYLGRRVIK